MVWRRNSQNGQGEWRHWLPVPGDIVHLHAAEGKVYVWTRPNDETTIMDAGTGETQHVASFNDARELLLVRDDAALAGYGALMSFGLDADQPAWRAILSGGIYETPAITNSTIYVRSGEAVGRVYALERSSGEVTWSTAENIRSNLAHTSQGLYVLTDRGELQLLDPLSGQPTTLLQFHPQELPVGLDNGGYYLAASEETGTLYVYLGATYQLMAFQFDSRQLSRPGDPGPTTLPPSNQLP
jgi:outer membrane protein assembly factor BamB